MKKFLTAKGKYFIAPLLLALGAGAVFFFLSISRKDPENIRFEKYIDQIFQEELKGNTLNLHYTLAYPEDYGIKDYSVSLGTMKPEALKENLEETRVLNKKLKSFDSGQLSEENQIIYDILSLEFSSQLSLGSSYLLAEPLGPNLGIQAQLPILLAEYTLRTSADIKDYFSLLSQIPDYFQSILEFEEEKARRDLFMSDASADRIIRQCQSFMETGEENYLYSMFRQQIEELLTEKRITQDQADSFIEMQEKLMDQCVFPAYLTLSQGLEDLKGQGKNSGGLAHLEGGKEYYVYLIRSTVGDYRSPEEILQSLFLRLQTDYRKVQELLSSDPQLLSRAYNLTPSDLSPEQMLDYLQHVVTDDFPGVEVDSYEVKYVPESMEDFSSPAFYLTPPVDTLTPNTIYINQASQVSPAELFTTLAHEGFPGHLYQTVYFSKQDHHPIRELLSCSGYIEGWATYVEALSYDYASPFLHIDQEILDFLCLNRSISLCLYAILDLGIHDQGWNAQTTADTLAVFGITDPDTCQEIFQYIVENPANYLKYYLGYLNFLDLREEVQSTAGSSFSPRDFHKNLLDIGPAPFPVVEKYLFAKYE
ncbi:MAG TPA: DUF885 domain-containing protein [Candidatus Blautia pullistercoris]|uniref:DUF885 domain-containing protein n=1 Tax=Candidatus Blautia pullistercoris TaxID=2838499 RepID=A0A9D2AMN8_9FIRM|nr:DUF885 domain-containing protein [Candidatus Blautia pullistercoris]